MERTRVGAVSAVGVLLAALAGLQPVEALFAGVIVGTGYLIEGVAPLLEGGAEIFLGVEIPMMVTELPHHLVGLAAAHGLVEFLFAFTASAATTWLIAEAISNRGSSS